MKIKIFNLRINDDYFEKDQENLNSFLSKVVFKKSSVHFVEGETSFWSVFIHYEEKEENYIESKENKQQLFESEQLTEKEQEIVAYFKQWRLDKSREEGVPAYMILTNKTIISIAKNKPETMEDLDQISGIGPNKKSQYGESIIALMNAI